MEQKRLTKRNHSARPLAGVVALALVLLLSACANGEDSNVEIGAAQEGVVEDSSLTIEDVTGGPILVHRPVPDGQDIEALAAEIIGEIRISDECVSFQDMAIVWPAGSQWVADDQSIALPNGEVVVHGATVNGGGGFLSIDGASASIGVEISSFVEACEFSDPQVAVLNVQGEVTTTAPNQAAVTGAIRVSASEVALDVSSCDQDPSVESEQTAPNVYEVSVDVALPPTGDECADSVIISVDPSQPTLTIVDLTSGESFEVGQAGEDG